MKVIPKSIHHLLDDSKGGIKKSYLEENYYDKDYIDDNFVSEADVSNFVTIQGPLQTVLGEKKLKNISLLNIPGTAPSSSDIDTGKSYLYSSYGSYAEVPGGGGGGGGETLTVTKNGSAWLSYNGSQSVSLNLAIPTTVASLSDASDYATKTWVENKGYITSAALSGYVTIATDQEITGAKYFSNALAIPLSAPSSPTSGLSYLYAGSGSYAEEPGGGVADVYPLTITKNGSSWLYYDPGEEAVSVNLSVPTKVSDLTNDTGFITSSALNGYATEQWVLNKGYITSSALSGYVNDFEVTGSGNAVTTGSKSGSKITLTKDNTFVDLTSEQKITGAKKHANVALLNIPTSISSSDIESGKVYLYSGSGEYAEEASGGVADVYPLYLVIGGTTTTYDPASESTTVTFGSAAKKGYTTSITQGSADLPTSDAVYSAIAAAVTSALHYRGMSSTALTDGGTETAVIGGESLVPQSGDVVIYGGFEFLWENSVWNKLGDDSSYALKTIQISAGTGLTGGGDLTASRTLSLSSATQTDIGKGVTAYNSLGNYLPLAGNSTSSYVTGPVYFDAGNNSCVIKNIFYNTTTGWSRDVVRLAVDGTNKFTIGAYGSYTQGGSSNGLEYAYIGCNAYNGLNLRITSDSLKWGSNVIYHAGNLTKSVLTTILDSDGGYYLKLTGGTLTGTLNARDILPSATTTYALGSSSKKWNEAWVAKAHISSLLAIPTEAPQSSSIVSGEAYLYSSTGSYAETPGGGVADVYPLTITKNGSAWLSYDPGVQAESINLAIPTKVSDLTNDTGFITASSIPSTYAWSAITNTPTTLSGYGITDAKIETPSGTTNKKITLGSNNFTIYSWALASSKPSYAFSDLTSHPTTLSGYGITDAKIANGTITLGSNSITPLTSFTETDPTVPSWAKASTKPSYTLSEVAGSSAVGSTGRGIYYNGSGFAVCTFTISSYTLGGTKTVRIAYPSNAPVIISVQRNNGGGRLILVGGGYGKDAWTRNDFQEIVSPSTSYFTWCLSNTACSLEIKNITSGDSYVNVWTHGPVTFTEISDLTRTADNRTLWTSANLTPGDYLPLAGGTMTGAIVPNAANTIDLGTSTYYWKGVYATTFYGLLNDFTYLNNHPLNIDNAAVKGVNFHYANAGTKPTGSQDGSAFTLAWSSAWVTQMYGDWRTNKFYTRVKTNGTWGDWAELATTKGTVEGLNTSTETDATFVHRAVPSVAVGDSGVIKKIHGNTIAWNQKLETHTNYWGLIGFTGSVSNNVVTLTAASGISSNARIEYRTSRIGGTLAHKYLVRVTWKPSKSATTTVYIAGAYASASVTSVANVKQTASFYVSATGANDEFGVYFNNNSALSQGDTVEVYSVICIDLTLMGISDSVTTAAQFEALYPLPYYSYNAGEVVSLTAAKKVKLNNQAASYDSSDWALLSSTYCAKTTNAATQAIILTSKSNSSAAKGVKLNNFSFVVGHKYYIRAELDPTTHIGFYSSNNAVIFNTDVSRKGVVGEVTSSTSYFGLRLSNSAVNNTSYTFCNIMCVDLTLMYGAGFEPSAREFEHDFPQKYIPYNATGVDATIQGGLKTEGFNLYPSAPWNHSANTTWPAFSPDKFARVTAGVQYYLSHSALGITNWRHMYKAFDLNGNVITANLFTSADGSPYCNTTYGYWMEGSNNTLTAATMTFAQDCYVYFGFGSGAVTATTPMPSDFCFNVYDTSRNGTYEPHWESTLPLHITTVTSGGNAVFADGMNGIGGVYDELTSSKAVKRIGIVDLGSLAWDYDGTYKRFYATLTGSKRPADNSLSANMLGAIYTTTNFNTFLGDTTLDKMVAHPYNNDTIQIRNLAYTTAAAFTTAMSGVYLVYELATPVEYTLDSLIPLFFKSDKLGTQTLTPENTAVVSTAPLNADFQYGSNLGDAAGANEGYLPLAGGRVTGELNMSAGELVIPDHAPYQPEPNKHYLYVNDNGNYYQS